MRKRILNKLLSVTCLLVLISTTEASQPSSRGLLTGFDFLVEQLPSEFSSGTVTVRIKAVADTVFDQFRLQFIKFDRIEYSGPMELTAPAVLGDTALFEFSVYVPVNDTAGFVFRLYGGGGFVGNTGDVSKYWITTGRTAESWTSDPRAVNRYWNPPPKFDYSSSRTADSLEAEMAKNPPYTTEGSRMTDENGVPFSDEELRRRAIARIAIDSGWIPADYDTTDPHVRSILGITGDRDAWLRAKQARKDSLKEASQSTPREHMIELEKTPLDDGLLQNIYVDGVLYTRTRGETKFRVSENQPIDGDYTDADFQKDMREYRRKLTENDTNTIYRVILDLRKSEHFKAAESLKVNLIPADSVGFYKTEIKSPVYNILVKQLGVPSYYWPEESGENTPDDNDSKKKESR